MPGNELPPEPEGVRFLRLTGYDYLIGKPSKGRRADGSVIMAEEFLDTEVCRKFARPIFLALESLDPKDQRYDQFRKAARQGVEAYMDPQVVADAAAAATGSVEQSVQKQ